MAINNYFNATPVSIDFNAVKQVDSKPAASGFADGNIIFDKTEQQFYQALSGSWIALDFIGDDFTVNKLAFNTAATETLSTGELAWNADDETVDMHVGDDVTIQLGQEMVYHVVNQTGTQIDNGTVVMADGALGASGKIKVVPAIADGSVPAKYIMGVATEDIPNGALGYVTAFGKVRGFNTSSYSSGTVLYASATSSGSFTDTSPSLPNQKVTVAITLDQKSNGNIFVRPTYDDRRKSVSSISDLENVNTTENDVVYLDAGGRSGWFKFDSTDHSTATGTGFVDDDPGQGVYIAPSSDASGASGAWVRSVNYGDQIDASWFGVVADGATLNDTALSHFVNFLGIDLREGKLPTGDILISETWNINRRVTIYGHGKLEANLTSPVATKIVKNGSFLAVKLSAGLASLRSCVVDGNNNGGNGIQLTGTRCGLEHVTSLRHAGIGIIIGDPDNAGGNYNQWYMREVISRNNGSHGVFLDDASGAANVNGGVGYGVKLQDNDGDGIRIGNADVNTFIGVYAETNSGIGLHVTGGTYNLFFNAGSEGNTGGNAIFQSGTSNNFLFGAHNFSATDNGNNTILRATGGTNQFVHLSRQLKMGAGTFRPTNFNNGVMIESTSPGLGFYESDASANEKQWEILGSGGTLNMRVMDDNGLNPVTWFQARRNATNVFEARFISTPVKMDQGLGAYGATPPSQQGPLTSADSGFVNSGDATTDTVINNMRTRINELETALQAYGLLS